MSAPLSPFTDSTDLKEEMTASAPGKVFILGEYAALTGRTAVVAALGPRFRLVARTQVPAAGTEFDPRSPVGRLIERARSIGIGEEAFGEVFYDPHAGRGGFGASTAQFALMFSRTFAGVLTGVDPSSSNHRPKERRHWESAWVLYRELTRGAKVPPSGADLVAQVHGGVVAFDWSLYPRVEALTSAFPWSDVMVFTATDNPARKVPTHHHLNDLDPRSSRFDSLLSELEPAIERGLSAIRLGDRSALGRVLAEYAEILSRHGLEHEGARADREAVAALGSKHGLLGVKGAGALLSDGMIAVVEPHADRTAIERIAADRGLRLIARNLVPEQGLRFDD